MKTIRLMFVVLAGCECGGARTDHVDGGGREVDAAPFDARVELDASARDAGSEPDALVLDALVLDASCADAGGPHVVDDAGMCPPGWEPTPGGWCVTDFVPPAVCR